MQNFFISCLSYRGNFNNTVHRIIKLHPFTTHMIRRILPTLRPPPDEDGEDEDGEEPLAVAQACFEVNVAV